jgi:hypothetical protein
MNSVMAAVPLTSMSYINEVREAANVPCPIYYILPIDRSFSVTARLFAFFYIYVTQSHLFSIKTKHLR